MKSAVMRSTFVFLLLPMFGMMVAFAESLDSLKSFNDELIDSDYSGDLSSELLASDPCSKNSNPNSKLRARKNVPKLCRPRKLKPPKMEDPPVGTPDDIDIPSQFPIPVPTTGSDEDLKYCTVMSIGLLNHALCASGDPGDIVRFNEIRWGMMTWKLSFATIGQSHGLPLELPCLFPSDQALSEPKPNTYL